MSNLNRKGPLNEGPMTGRKLGRCNPDNKGKSDEEIYQQQDNTYTGRGQGFGRGFGRRAQSRGRGRGMGLGRGQNM
ncbi:MAG: DUF5320 domain-containing protein [Bacteroidales bacterium]